MYICQMTALLRRRKHLFEIKAHVIALDTDPLGSSRIDQVGNCDPECSHYPFHGYMQRPKLCSMHANTSLRAQNDVPQHFDGHTDALMKRAVQLDLGVLHRYLKYTSRSRTACCRGRL